MTIHVLVYLIHCCMNQSQHLESLYKFIRADFCGDLLERKTGNARGAWLRHLSCVRSRTFSTTAATDKEAANFTTPQYSLALSLSSLLLFSPAVFRPKTGPNFYWLNPHVEPHHLVDTSRWQFTAQWICSPNFNAFFRLLGWVACVKRSSRVLRKAFYRKKLKPPFWDLLENIRRQTCSVCWPLNPEPSARWGLLFWKITTKPANGQRSTYETESYNSTPVQISTLYWVYPQVKRLSN